MLLACPLTTRAQAPSERCRQAVVHLDGGSGVCVSADGWIVTAAHMLPGWPFDPPELKPRHNPWFPSPPPPLRRPPASVAVTWENGTRLQARVCVIQDVAERSDLAILKAEGTGLPFRPLATKPPAIGDPAYAAGWPAGNWGWNECRIAAMGDVPVDEAYAGRRVCGVLDMITVNYRANPGGSGGPLFNSAREVIGICSRATTAGPQASRFARWEHVTANLLKAGYTESRTVSDLPVLQKWINSEIQCAPCIRYDADYARGIMIGGVLLQESFRVETHDMAREPQIAAKLGVVRVPSFVTPDGVVHEGYTSPEALAAILVQYQFPIVSGVPPPVAPVAAPAVPAPAPSTDPPAAPPVESEPDVEGIRVLVLVGQLGELGTWAWVKGIALSKLERALEVNAPAKVKDVFAGKVQGTAVFRRLHPTRHEQLTTAAATSDALVNFVVLVPEKFDGLPGKLAAFVEPKLKAVAELLQLDSFQTLLIFERSDSVRYHDVIEELKKDEPVITDERLTLGTAGAATGGLIAWFRRRRQPSPVP